MRCPQCGQCLAAASPHPFMALDIVEEAREAGRARRMADQAHMQATDIIFGCVAPSA